MNDIARPWSEHTYVSARRTQGEVWVEENLATNLKRLALLLFRCRKDSHLIDREVISGQNPFSDYALVKLLLPALDGKNKSVTA